nr:reverse transcriptase domain-containing protein [Tanacetum cinerariifolium]
MGENHASWSDKLDDALWAFRTAFKTPIGCTPYKLVYGKACIRKVSLMLEILSRRFFLKLNLSVHMSILTDLQGTLKGKWRYLIPAEPPNHNHMLIPNYQDFKIQDFRYSDGFECFQDIKIRRYEHDLLLRLWDWKEGLQGIGCGVVRDRREFVCRGGGKCRMMNKLPPEVVLSIICIFSPCDVSW